MRKIWIILTLFSAVFAGCKKTLNTAPPADNPLVIEGFIYAGQPVDHIHLEKISRVSDSGPNPVDNAYVTLSSSDGTSVVLAQKTNEPGTYFDSAQVMLIKPGNSYTLWIKVEDSYAIATTSVPAPIDPVTITPGDSLYVDPTQPSQVLLTLKWAQISGHKFLLTDSTITENASPIGFANGGNNQTPFGNLISTNTVSLEAGDFKKYGWHNIKITAVDNVFSVYYTAIKNGQSPPQSTPSNITNAHGIFTSFNYATPKIYLY